MHYWQYPPYSRSLLGSGGLGIVVESRQQLFSLTGGYIYFQRRAGFRPIVITKSMVYRTAPPAPYVAALYSQVKCTRPDSGSRLCGKCLADFQLIRYRPVNFEIKRLMAAFGDYCLLVISEKMVEHKEHEMMISVVAHFRGFSSPVSPGILIARSGFACDSVRRREMERILSDDPEAEERAAGVLKQLRLSLQLLASPAQTQLSHFPVPWIVLTDEMALDFDHWSQCVATYWRLSDEQVAQLVMLDEFLSTIREDLWTDEALSTHPRWEKVRTLAKTALVSFEWSLVAPPPTRLLPDGSVIDGE